MRFVVIATIRRGAVDPPEPLDDEGQAAAFRQLGFERQGEATVIWKGSQALRRMERATRIFRGPDGKQRSARRNTGYQFGERRCAIDRMMRLAAQGRPL